MFLFYGCVFYYVSALWQISSKSEVYVGFVDSASRHTRRLASTTWVIFTPASQLVSSGGVCLGEATNNVFEYSVVIELLRDALSHGISHLLVHLDA
jgi:ribonuclease HI